VSSILEKLQISSRIQLIGEVSRDTSSNADPAATTSTTGQQRSGRRPG
jgi:hypothetical protein